MPDNVVTAEGLVPARRAVEAQLDITNVAAQGLAALKFRLDELSRDPSRVNALIGTAAAHNAHFEKKHTSGWRTRVRFIAGTEPVVELEAHPDFAAAMKIIRQGAPPQSPRVPENAIWVPLSV